MIIQLVNFVLFIMFLVSMMKCICVCPRLFAYNQSLIVIFFIGMATGIGIGVFIEMVASKKSYDMSLEEFCTKYT
jgi:fatty-acid desaturase